MTVLLTSLLALSVSCAVVSAKCTEGDTAPIEGKCKEFQVCKDGEWVTDSCNTWLRKYSREQKKCDWWFKVDCDELSRCSEEGEILRNPLTCSSYYKCESGKLVSHQCIWPFYFDGTGCRFWASCETVGNNQSVKYADLCTGDESEPIADHCFWYKTCGKDGVFEQTRCSYGKQFNVTTKTCDWFWKVDCSISTCDGKARATEPNGKTYYQCSNGFLMKKTCGPLQKFDVEKERCVFASPFSAVQLESVRNTIANVTDLANDADVRQVEEILRNLAQQEPNAVPTATDKAPLPIVRASNSSVLLRRLRRADSCTSGSFAVDANCLDYKECVSGTWVSKRCPDHMIFSNNQCRWGWEATCDPKSCIKGTNKVYPSDCTKYLHCDDNNNQVVTDCPGKWLLIKYRFNPKSSSCEKVWRWESCPSSSYLMTCPEGGEFNPKTEMCEKKKTKRSVGNNPADCISGDTKYDIITGACSSYMFCTDEGRWARRACPKGQFFNGQGSCSETPCPFEAVPGNCEAFKLSNGTIVNCDFGMRFDKITKQCVIYAEANCAEIECEGLERKNHPISCKRYLQCTNQQWTVEDCGWFQNKFDMRTRECVFGWWGHAATCRYDPAECADGVKTPIGTNCRDYVTCISGTEQESTCFWPMKFDSESKRCVWWGAKCF